MKILHLLLQVIALLTLMVFLILMSITFWQFDNIILKGLLFGIWVIVALFLMLWLKPTSAKF